MTDRPILFSGPTVRVLLVVASTLPRLLGRLGLVATRRRLSGCRAGFGHLVWQWHRLELHLRRHSLPRWRRLLGAFVVFAIAHCQNPFVPRAQLAASRKVPLKGETV